MSGRFLVAVRRRVHSRPRQRGSVAVEFGLIAPVLIMLLMGTITTGMSYSRALGVTNAVREGARFGAIADSSAGSWSDDVIKRVHFTELNDVGLPQSKTTVCVQLFKLPNTASAVKEGCDAALGPGIVASDYTNFPIPPVTTSLPAGVCIVRVVATRQYLIQAPPFLPAIPRKLTRGSVARYEGDSC